MLHLYIAGASVKYVKYVSPGTVSGDWDDATRLGHQVVYLLPFAFFALSFSFLFYSCPSWPPPICRGTSVAPQSTPKEGPGDE